MHKQAVIGIIKKIFTYYGYNISPSEISDLLAEKDTDHLFVKYENSANLNSVRYFSNSVERYGGKGLLILESVDEKTRSFALDKGITVWDMNELESWVGRAVLSGALEENFEKPFEKTSPKEEESFPPMQPQVQFQQEAPPEPSKTTYEKTIRIILRSVPVNIGKSDSLSIAEAKIGKIRSHKLNFIPVWHYIYSFSTQKMFKSRLVDLTGDGEGYIHALTGENSFTSYKNIQDNTIIPTQKYEIKQPAITKKDALSKALESIIREHSKEIRLNEMIGDTIIFENKVFSPDPESIDLKMELLYIPVWEIRGIGETIEINGYDGHIVAVKSYSDAEFV